MDLMLFYDSPLKLPPLGKCQVISEPQMAHPRQDEETHEVSPLAPAISEDS